MKLLQNNFTTPEQSKRLLELGVPAWTADCFRWDFYSGFGVSEGKRYSTCIAVLCYEYQRNFRDKLPCWSSGRLREIYQIVGEEAGQCVSCSKEQTQVESLVQLYEENIELLDFSKLNDYGIAE
jgi:hypothetical protein